MYRTARVVAFVLAMIFSTHLANAENSQLVKVDLDLDSTVIVKADLDQLGWYYYIDKTACVCWVAAKSTIEAGPSTFDCAKLKAHPALADHVAQCGGGGSSGYTSPAGPPSSSGKSSGKSGTTSTEPAKE